MIVLTQIEPKNKNLFAVGESAPNFNGVDQNGISINSSEVLASKNIVLIFYRGSWCPYCIKHLKKVQDNLESIEKTGTKVIVVTSEAPYSIEKTISKTGATFSIIADTNNIILDQFGVSYEANETTVPRFTDYVINQAKESNQDETPILPISSAYVIGKDNKFKYIYFDLDYRERVSLDDIKQILLNQ
jgi:peroxiredoxin